MKLAHPVSSLKTVGPAFEKRLYRLGIQTIKDLLLYFPFRYEDFRSVVPISQLRDGMQVTIRGKIELIGAKRSPRRRTMITEAVVADASEQVQVVWFGQPYIAKTLKGGDEVYLSGKVKEGRYGVQMIGPTYERAGNETVHTARLVPMYPLTAGITQKQMRFLVRQAIDIADQLEDLVPDDILEKGDFVPMVDAVRGIHFPVDDTDFGQAERRMKFDELFILQLRAEAIRQSIQSHKAPALAFRESEIKTFVDSLPFTLTKAQKVSAWEILQDMDRPEPMNRLLEGDVGSGKTVVAAMALYNAILNGKQAVIMAPTEILAKQHYESIVGLLGAYASVGILTRTEMRNETTEIEGKTKKAQKEFFLEKIKDGSQQILVGTHALLSESVQFKDLGLVIVDEQHRFGVAQRKTIREKSGNSDTTPHFLSMTATPIPRSFALALYGDLDISIINEMPVGRKPVKTRAVDAHNREKAYEFIREQVKKGRQVFVVCSKIGGGESVSEKKTVMDEYEKLSAGVFSDLNVGFVHGKLKAAEKDKTMKQFAAGEIDILVSTSVVEVGVNIPNASVMMIEGAESFGLAQLHQFRGRVGRSVHQSYCFLFTESLSEKVGERLTFFETHTDGFKVAEYDLEVRGPGEVYGTSQSGLGQLRFATLQDAETIKLARECAKGIDFGKYPELKEKVREWEKKVHLE